MSRLANHYGCEWATLTFLDEFHGFYYILENGNPVVAYFPLIPGKGVVQNRFPPGALPKKINQILINWYLYYTN
jgi:hypothetical protein